MEEDVEKIEILRLLVDFHGERLRGFGAHGKLWVYTGSTWSIFFFEVDGSGFETDLWI